MANAMLSRPPSPATTALVCGPFRLLYGQQAEREPIVSGGSARKAWALAFTRRSATVGVASCAIAVMPAAGDAGDDLSCVVSGANRWYLTRAAGLVGMAGQRASRPLYR